MNPAHDGTNRYVALLRGINVGGANLIRMTDLKASFEDLGFQDVSTYIASGNVLFCAKRTAPHALAARIERALSKAFDYKATVVLRSHRQMEDVVDRAPRGFGARPATYRYDVVYLKEPLTAPEALESVSTRKGVDRAYAGDGVIYFARLDKRAAQSHLPRLVSLPVYQSMTIRNWNTTTKLLKLMRGE